MSGTTSDPSRSSPGAAGRARGGKYLTFELGGEEYGLEILKVQEIIGLLDITPVPRMPVFVKGVINLRGRIIPVVDLRARFDMPAVARTPENCIIVVQVAGSSGRVTMGVIVDKVSEVADIADGQIEDAPEFGVDLHTDFILGMGKIGSKVVIILDVDRVLTTHEKALIAGVGDPARG
jgi:purine-binding chemotaxis protein CheW